MIEFGSKNEEVGRSAPFLISTEEGEENEIKFVVALAAEGEKGTNIDDMGIPKLGALLKDSVPLYPSEKVVYEILFDEYLIHQTRNESLTRWDDYEIRQGKYFILFEKSRFLDYMDIVVERVIAKAYWKKGWKHYGIYCQNHIIDIISPSIPAIRKVHLTADRVCKNVKGSAED
ncbi:hypothetical protein [Selenomonas sp. F0473]|uniref:hypothetical protein n=1 Tax=Selenomonas sp. F0473 TaxID=999423 RepID=UPI00029E7639|nr:hypothetical protein [Selenomonas sp. F0473]EKU71561.1 hypothetical protein HMPREF9161_00246 [Selenomonas sp. F0473]